MSPVLAIVLGNSTAAAALAVDDSLTAVRRMPVTQLDGLHELLARGCPDSSEAWPIIVASVNPPALERVRQLVAEMSLPAPAVAGVDFPIPIKTDLKEPERIGTDRLLGALAAYRRTKGPCIVVDCGTATTVNAVSQDGTFLGGAILPGPELMARALAEGTAQLPEVQIGPVASAIGKSTEEAILAGIIHGWRGAVWSLIEGISDTTRPMPSVVLTGGGLEALLKGHLRSALADPAADPRPVLLSVDDLVLEGLVIAYREWQGR